MSERFGNRASDQTGNEQIMALQALKLNNALKELSRWQVSITAEVTPEGDFKINTRKQNGRGFIRTIPNETVMYYQSDFESFFEIITQDIYEQLIKEELFEDVKLAIGNGFRNVITITNARGR